MKAIYNILRFMAVPLILTGALSSCMVEDTADEHVYLRVTPYIDIEYPADYDEPPKDPTKAPIEGQFSVGTSTSYRYFLGFNITRAGGSAGDPDFEYAGGYNNIQTRYHKISSSQPPEMIYTIGQQSSENKLPLYKSGGDVILSGYYPYHQNVTDIRAIPIDVRSKMNGQTGTSGTWSVLNDWMWFEPVSINISDPSALNFAIGLKHAQTYLALNFKPKGSAGVSYVYLHRIIYETADGGNWLPAQGLLDATNGKLDVTEYVNSLEIVYNVSLQSDYDRLTGVMLPQVPATKNQSDRKLKITIYANYISGTNPIGEPLVSEPIILDISQIHDNKGNYGLRTGYKYTVNLMFNNITKFHIENIPSAEPWEEKTVDIEV